MDLLKQISELMETEKLLSVKYEFGDTKIKIVKAEFKAPAIDEIKPTETEDEDTTLFWSAER